MDVKEIERRLTAAKAWTQWEVYDRLTRKMNIMVGISLQTEYSQGKILGYHGFMLSDYNYLCKVTNNRYRLHLVLEPFLENRIVSPLCILCYASMCALHLLYRLL